MINLMIRKKEAPSDRPFPYSGTRKATDAGVNLSRKEDHYTPKVCPLCENSLYPMTRAAAGSLKNIFSQGKNS